MVVIGVLLTAVAVLFYFYSSGSEGATLTSSEEVISPVSNEILATLGNLRSIKLDNTLFQDPLFLSLSDFGVTIPPAAAGRRNPFAPVGQGGGPTSGAGASPAPTGTSTPASTGTTTPAR